MIYDIIIIGAGPSGLACVIEAKKTGLKYLVVEKGGITDAIRRFPINMTFFSTPELLELDDIPFTITSLRPNRVEALEYYRQVVAYHELNLKLHTMVHGFEKEQSQFKVKTDHGDFQCRRVVVATGYFDNPNMLMRIVMWYWWAVVIRQRKQPLIFIGMVPG